jgi:cyanophycin synthetase
MRWAASMELRAIVPYVGASLYAEVPSVRLDFAGDAAVNAKATDIPGLFEFLSKVFRLSSAQAGAWAELKLPALIGKVALALHNVMLPAKDWFEVSGDSNGLIHVVFASSDSVIGAIAARTAFAWIDAFAANASKSGSPLPAAGNAMANFSAEARRHHLGANANLIIGEAMRRQIPCRRVSPSDMTVLLGHGNRQQRLRETLISGQGKLASDTATKKHVANRLLAMAGLPVPRHFLVEDPAAAARAAKLIGYPVVVKPAGTDRGTAVHVDIRNEDALRPAVADALRHGAVLVEQLIRGFDFRILILGGRMLAATRRIPAFVVGDGQQTVRQLIDQENRRPRRMDGYHPRFLQHIKIDQDLVNQLAHQGLGLDAVPIPGAAIRLHGTANVSTGGIPVDVTREVHEDNRNMFIRAARVLGLEMAGIDFLTPDITKSYREIGGAICEANSVPGLRVHVAANGSPDVVSMIVDHLFPAGSNGRIPTVAITGTNGKTTTSRMVATVLRQEGHCVGLATTDGVTVDGIEVAQTDLAGIPGAAMVLHDPAVTAAVLETARGGLIRAGLAFDHCDVAAVLNVRDDHLGFDGIETRDDMARVKSVVLKTARKAVVLNADDKLCIDMVPLARAETVWFFAREASSDSVRAHIDRGLPAVTLTETEGEAKIVCWREGKPHELMPVAAIPCTFQGRAAFNVDNALAAVAISLAHGLSTDAIVAALSGFTADPIGSRGRCNFIDGLPFRVVVDYAHNPDGVGSLCRFLATEKVAGRRHLILTSFGNRLDNHFLQMGAAAAGSFDRYICTTNGPRNRTVAEVSQLLAQGLIGAGVDAAHVEQAASEAAAVDLAVSQALPGDMIVLLSGNGASAIRYFDRLRQRLAETGGPTG